MLSIWKTVGKKTLRAWVGSKFLKSYERGFEDGKKVDARDKQVMYKEAYRYGLAEGKAALANAYNSGYRDADLDRREKNDSNNRSNCRSCVHNPNSDSYKSIGPKKTS